MVLALSTRQVHRLLRRLSRGGARRSAHKARGRPSNNRIRDEVRDQALALVRTHYADFGPTLAAEMLAQRHELKVSRETLRGWMTDAGLWLSRKQRRSFHQPRLRREALGELVQIDGSEHRWFEDRAEPCTLLVFIDDASGRLMQLRFVTSESAFAYFEALQGYLEAHGCPVAFYSDKHSVFRVARKDAKGGQGMTQFGRALAELNIEILCANSSQAKGRVERVNRTLQDRLVKELRMAGISDTRGRQRVPAGLHRALQRPLRRRPRPPGRSAPAAEHPARPPARHPLPARAALCRAAAHPVLRAQADHAGAERATDRARRASMSTPTPSPTAGSRCAGRGCPCPIKVFDKDQRVTHAAIVENKRLGEVLAFIKSQQDQRPPPRLKTNSERIGYQKTGRKPPGRKRFVDRMMARRRAAQLAAAPK